MSALEWHRRMKHAPTLRHSEGMVLIDLDGRSVVFPSDADARFFHAAYTDVPALAAEVDALRREIDEGALHRANERARALLARVAELEKEKADLEARHATEVERRTEATRRATVLARTLRRIRERL